MARTALGSQLCGEVCLQLRRPNRLQRCAATGHVTVPEMAALLGVTRVAAYAYIKNGLIPVFLLAGRKNLIRLADVVEFRKRRQSGEFNYRRLFPFGDE